MPRVEKTKPSSLTFFRKQGNILNVAITGTTERQLLTKILAYFKKNRHFKAKLASKRPLFITTPNPEQVVIAQTDREYMQILNGSDVALCDGVGLLTAYEYKKRVSLLKRPFVVKKIFVFLESFLYVVKNGRSSDKVLRVIKGRDFFLDLLKIADEKKYKVFLLGATSAVINRTFNKLSKRYPSVHFKIFRGANFNDDSVPLTDKEIKSNKISLRKINRFAPQMLFVAFGAPKQEKWVYRHIDELKTGLVMVVGGTFDYIAGTRKSVPSVFGKLGLEWFWRFITGSQNIRRILNAVIKFPMLILSEETD